MRGIRLSSEVAAWIGQNLKRVVSGNTHDAYLWLDVDESGEGTAADDDHIDFLANFTAQVLGFSNDSRPLYGK